MRGKMIPPLPEGLGKSEHERFQHFAKAVLTVPKSEIMPGRGLGKTASRKAKG